MFRRSVATAACQSVIFLAVGLAVTWPSLNYPWFGDDLHLVREFSSEELRSVWANTWDVDGLETGGYRPLTAMFNHARARVLGENVVAHRVFLIALCAVYLGLIGLIGRRFGLTPSAMLLAGVMMVCAKYTCYHLVWIADGVHVAQGVMFALSAVGILRWIESDRLQWWWTSVLWYVLAVLLREDSLATAPVLVGMAVLLGRTKRRLAAQRNGLIAYAVAITLVSSAVLLARQAVIVADTDPWTPPLDLIAHLVAVVTLAGWQPFIFVALFGVIFAMLVIAAARHAPAGAQMAWFWLVCAAVSTAPAIVMTRVNLLFFPITFYCIFAADILTRCARGELPCLGRWHRPLAIVVAVCCVALPAYGSRRQQLSMAHGSSSRLEANCNIARSGPLAPVTPILRRDAVLDEMRRLGITPAVCDELVDSSGAVKSGVRLPQGIFEPPTRFLSR